MKNEENNDKFFVLTGKQFKALGFTAENRPTINLNPAEVPPKFRYLIPLVEYWGINDDVIRNDVIEKAPIEKLRELVEIVTSQVDNELDEWLAGPEAYAKEVSEAYIAFTALRLAAEEAEFFVNTIDEKSE